MAVNSDHVEREAATLQGLLSGGVDQWQDMEKRLLSAQNDMAGQLQQQLGAQLEHTAHQAKTAQAPTPTKNKEAAKWARLFETDEFADSDTAGGTATEDSGSGSSTEDTDATDATDGATSAQDSPRTPEYPGTPVSKQRADSTNTQPDTRLRVNSLGSGSGSGAPTPRFKPLAATPVRPVVPVASLAPAVHVAVDAPPLPAAPAPSNSSAPPLPPPPMSDSDAPAAPTPLASSWQRHIPQHSAGAGAGTGTGTGGGDRLAVSTYSQSAAENSDYGYSPRGTALASPQSAHTRKRARKKKKKKKKTQAGSDQHLAQGKGKELRPKSANLDLAKMDDDALLFKHHAPDDQPSPHLAHMVKTLESELAEQKEIASVLRDIVETAKQGEAQAQMEMARLTAELEESQTAVREKEQQLLELKHAVESVQTRSGSNEKAFEDQVAALEKERARLEEVLAVQLRDMETTRQQLQEKLQDLRTVQSKLHELDSAKQTAEAEATRQRHRADAVSAQLQDRMKEVADLRTQTVIEKERNTALQREKETLKLANESMQHAQDIAMQLNRSGAGGGVDVRHQAEVQRLQERLSTELERYRQLEDSTHTQIRDLKQQLYDKGEELKQRVADFETRIRDTFDGKRDADRQLAALSQELSTARRDLATQRMESKQAAEQLQLMRDELAKHSTQVSQLREAKIAVQEKLQATDREREILAETLSRTEEERDRALSEKAQLNSTLAVMTQSLQRQLSRAGGGLEVEMDDIDDTGTGSRRIGGKLRPRADGFCARTCSQGDTCTVM